MILQVWDGMTPITDLGFVFSGDNFVRILPWDSSSWISPPFWEYVLPFPISQSQANVGAYSRLIEVSGAIGGSYFWGGRGWESPKSKEPCMVYWPTNLPEESIIHGLVNKPYVGIIGVVLLMTSLSLPPRFCWTRNSARMSCWNLVTILSKLGCFTY